MKPKNKEIAGRTMLMLGNEPVLVGLAMRQASSAPARIKAALVIPTVDKDGAMAVAPLPFAQATMGFRKPHGWTPELRLEMN